MLRRMQVGPCLALLTKLQCKQEPCNASLASSTLNPAASIAVPACCKALPSPVQHACTVSATDPLPKWASMALAPHSQLRTTTLRVKAA